ncbi:unnamed protein product [Taenia asiatica]|uniref:Acid phosphatase n=1 Tax=Taenia asiatica TaxID=60517 RepID=A0A0R3VY61_TAEAS|nr:unnamed protein product [Taenia asiatica]
MVGVTYTTSTYSTNCATTDAHPLPSLPPLLPPYVIVDVDGGVWRGNLDNNGIWEEWPLLDATFRDNTGLPSFPSPQKWSLFSPTVKRHTRTLREVKDCGFAKPIGLSFHFLDVFCIALAYHRNVCSAQPHFMHSTPTHLIIKASKLSVS